METVAFSFVVRIWMTRRPADPEYRGWVEYVQSGSRTPFRRLAQLPAIIATHTGLSPNRYTSWRQWICAHAHIVKDCLRRQDREKRGLR